MNKVPSIHDFSKLNDLSILGISETHLLPSITNSFVEVPGYTLIHNDTVSTNAKHGVLCYIHHSLKPHMVTYPCTNCLAFEIPAYGLLIIVAYCPPSNPPESNHALIDAVVLCVCPSQLVVLLSLWVILICLHSGGTYSPCLLTTSYQLINYSLIALTPLVSTQWVCEPTYPRSGNILDLFFTSDTDRVGQVRVLPPLPKCDHCPVIVDNLFKFAPSAVSQTRPSVLKARHWERGHYNIMMRQLSLVDWDFEFAHKDVDACFQRFGDILNSLVADLVPEKHPVDRPPWSIRPPGSPIRRRSDHWHAYKAARSLHGRRSPITVQSLLNFNLVNAEVYNY